jgi:ubiquinone/menaquinone biosynthesis C-methylase UbiE
MNSSDFLLKLRNRTGSAKVDDSIWQACSPYLDGSTRRLLDAGCGTGSNISRLLKQSDLQMVLFGVDLFSPDLQIAAKRFADQKCFFIQADACSLPFHEAIFNIVLSNQVIEHVKDEQAYIQEIARVLLPGNLCLLTTTNLERPINLFRRYILRKPYRLRWENWKNVPDEEYRGHRQEFTETTLKNLLEQNGLEVVAVKGINPHLTFEGSFL